MTILAALLETIAGTIDVRPVNSRGLRVQKIGVNDFFDNGNSGATKTIDWATKSNFQKLTLTANAVISFTAPTSPSTLTLFVYQDASGSRLATWPSIRWMGGSAPTLRTGAGQVDLISLKWDGTEYWGAANNEGTPSGSVAWGSITGTLSNQTDLNTALSGKAATSHTHTLSNLTQSGATVGQVPVWNGSAWAPATTGGGGGTPAGSATELQYRAGASTFGAITGSAFSGGRVTLPATDIVQGAATIGLKIDFNTDFATDMMRFTQSGFPDQYFGVYFASNAGDFALQYTSHPNAGSLQYGYGMRLTDGKMFIGRWDNSVIDLAQLGHFNVLTGVSIPSAGTQHGIVVFDGSAERMRLQMTLGTPLLGKSSVQLLHINSGDIAVCAAGNGSNGFHIWTSASGTLAEAARFDTTKNFGLGITTFGTSMTKGICVGTGVAPSTSPADAFQVYSADQAAGNACLHTRTENGAVIKLFQAAANADTSGATLGQLETEVNELKALLRANGLLAT